MLNSYRRFATGLCVLLLAGCGQVVKIKVPQAGSNPSDPNVNGTYLCSPSGESSFECKSGVAYSAADREVDAGQHCTYGVANVYVATNWQGGVTEIQYACALAPVTGFPTKQGDGFVARGPRVAPAPGSP